MIDVNGFRPNVGIIIINGQGDLFWARRVGGLDAWQFPQGGIKDGEEIEAALFRELYEEVGLVSTDVKVLGATRGWLRYRLPKRLIRNQEPVCVGQKQKWYLLQLVSEEAQISLERGSSPEFDVWQWVSYWYPVNKVVPFKRDVYRRALKELAPAYSLLIAQGDNKESFVC